MPKPHQYAVGRQSAVTEYLKQYEKIWQPEDVVIVGLDTKWAASARCQQGAALWVMARNFGTTRSPEVTVYETLESVPRKMFTKLIQTLTMHGSNYLTKIPVGSSLHNAVRTFLNSLQSS